MIIIKSCKVVFPAKIYNYQTIGGFSTALITKFLQSIS